MTRHLDWQGSYNIRDLGGLPSRDGQPTAWGKLVRGDAPNRLTENGWDALWNHGIRTIIDLRHEPDHRPEAAERPPGLTTVRLPLDNPADTDFWRRWAGGINCTPLYYRAFLDRFPEHVARVIATVADAPAGGVLIHCAGGRDRTGLIVLLLLALAEVPSDVIAADYDLSGERLEPAWRRLGIGDQTGQIAAFIARHGTTARQAVIDTVDSLDALSYLRDAGLTDAQLGSVRARLLSAPVASSALSACG